MATMAVAHAAGAGLVAAAGGSLIKGPRSTRTTTTMPPPPQQQQQQGRLCVLRAVSPEEDMFDMSNVGLDDVFNLIQQASNADPEPEDLVAPTTRKASSNTSGAAQWYKVYGRSVPANEDARAAYYGPKRPMWKGGFTSPDDVPAYLKGEYPGDYGCDILSLCKDPSKFTTLRAQELLNGRWAMLGVTGCLAPELINPAGTDGFEPIWFKTGAQIFSESGIDYLGVPGFINAHSIIAVAVVQVLLMGGAELARANAGGNVEGQDPLYPGGKAFDPLGFSSDSESFAELKVKEIKNGRLAMVAMAGLFAQGAVTGVSPLQNLHNFLKL